MFISNRLTLLPSPLPPSSFFHVTTLKPTASITLLLLHTHTRIYTQMSTYLWVCICVCSQLFHCNIQNHVIVTSAIKKMYIYMHIWILYIHRNIYTPCWATFSLCIFCVCMVSRLTILYWTIIKRTHPWGRQILLLPGVISGLQFLTSVWDSFKISPSALIHLFIHLFQSFFM